MSTKLPGYDDTVICPYNKCHVILQSRIQTHLVKCARSHPNIILETCPFNVTHRIRPEEMQAHKAECPSRASFDRYMYPVNTGGSSASAQPVKEEQRQPPRPRPTMAQQNNDDEEECWDHFDTPTYDPQRYAMNAKVFRVPTGLTPAQRRKFADQERKRLSVLSSNERNFPR